MSHKKSKKVAQRSRRSGVKTAELIKTNQQTIENIWTSLNSLQVLKNY